MRVVARFLDDDAEGFKAAFVDIASRFEMDWSLRPASQRRKVVALVSKFDHCLDHLLYARRIGEIDMDVVAIITNHPKEAITIKRSEESRERKEFVSTCRSRWSP